MEDNHSESIEQKIYEKNSENSNGVQPKPKEDNSSFNTNNSEIFNSTFDLINNKTENTTNELKKFSKTSKSTSPEIPNLNINNIKSKNEIETNNDETQAEIKIEQNSKTDSKNIYSEKENYNIEINSDFNEINNEVEKTKPLSSIDESTIKGKIETIKSSSLTNKNPSVKSSYNLSETFKDNIISINNSLEQGLKDKHELDKKSKLSLNDLNDLISHKGLNKNTRLIEEMNKFIQKELFESQIEQEKLKSKKGENKNEIIKKVDKNLIDVISEIFKIEKFGLAYDLLVYLELYDLTEEYQAEIFKYFNSKIKKIYDAKKDGDNLLILITKIFGKKNIVTFQSLSITNESLVQIAFLKGKLDFINNNFNFNDTELYTYGNYN